MKKQKKTWFVLAVALLVGLAAGLGGGKSIFAQSDDELPEEILNSVCWPPGEILSCSVDHYICKEDNRLYSVESCSVCNGPPTSREKYQAPCLYGYGGY